MDRPGVRKVPEGSGEQGKMEETGCKIICGAPTPLAVKGLMMIIIIMMIMMMVVLMVMMMMMKTDACYTPLVTSHRPHLKCLAFHTCYTPLLTSHRPHLKCLAFHTCYTPLVTSHRQHLKCLAFHTCYGPFLPHVTVHDMSWGSFMTYVTDHVYDAYTTRNVCYRSSRDVRTAL